MYAHCCIVLYMLPVNKHTHTHTNVYIYNYPLDLNENMASYGQHWREEEENRRCESHVSKFWRAQNPARQGAQFISVCRFMAPKMVIFFHPWTESKTEIHWRDLCFFNEVRPPFFPACFVTIFDLFAWRWTSCYRISCFGKNKSSLKEWGESNSINIRFALQSCNQSNNQTIKTNEPNQPTNQPTNQRTNQTNQSIKPTNQSTNQANSIQVNWNPRQGSERHFVLLSFVRSVADGWALQNLSMQGSENEIQVTGRCLVSCYCWWFRNPEHPPGMYRIRRK